MAQKYYNSLETAKILGITADDVKKMMERRELHGYRDGADWKFKVEDIDRMASERQAEQTGPSEEEGGDVLLSEVALGQGSVGTSGTVIAMDALGQKSAESDIYLIGSSDELVDQSSIPLATTVDDVPESKGSQFEDLNLTLDEDVTLEDSSATLRSLPAADGIAEGGSVVDLTGKELDDDDLVLGGSGIGSDVSIGGDSGISLVDPSDTGISLEQPLGLGGPGAESSLELGEADMLTVGEDEDPEPATVKTDDDFLLTPLEEAADDEDSESGSQVIALETEAEEDSLLGESTTGMASMLEEDLTSQSGLDMGLGEPMAGSPLLGGQPLGLSEGEPAPQPSVELPEEPYTGLQISGLVFCAVLLMFCGMMSFDLLRNMWSWDGPYTVNSWFMDLFVGK